jgi:Protein of unknown function (DUF552).
MKIIRNGLLGRVKNKIDTFLYEHEKIDIFVGKIQAFFGYKDYLMEMEEEIYEKDVIYQIKIYTLEDYKDVIELIEEGYSVIVDHSSIPEPYKKRSLNHLKFELMQMGMQCYNVSNDVIFCASKNTNVTYMDSTKKEKAKIIIFPRKYS